MEVILDKEIINVIINHKKNKNIYFRFDDDLNLVINVSPRVSEKEIRKLIEKNEKSLINLKNKCTRKIEKAGEFWYLGNKYNLVFDDTFTEIEFQNGTIYVKNEKVLEKFLNKKTKEIFAYEVDKMKEVIRTPEFKLRIRKMKTRWGVCNYKDNIITLNSELIKYNKEFLRYVIVHEMCHFYHHNHGKEFWNMVGIYYPNYKFARKELRS